MRRVFLIVLMILLTTSVGARAVTEEEKLKDAVKTGEIIRLHVVAAGDDEENQRIKLKVRDSVLAAWRDKLKDQKDAVDMFAYLESNRQALTDTAREAARAEGFSGDVSAQTGVFPFPDRWYGDVLVPAGDYKALRIVLGEGKGHNWWCVLFPSLCLSLATPEAPEETPEEENPDFTWWTFKVFSLWPIAGPV